MEEVKEPNTETTATERMQKGWSNLQPCRDTETARERGLKGAEKSIEVRRKKKELKEQINILLSMSLAKGKARNIVGDIADELEDTSYGNLLSIRMLQEALDGNVKSAEFIRDTAGQKPTTEVSLDANIITDKDKELLEKLAKNREK